MVGSTWNFNQCYEICGSKRGGSNSLNSAFGFNFSFNIDIEQFTYFSSDVLVNTAIVLY